MVFPQAGAGGCGSPASMGSQKPELWELRFKAADIISYSHEYPFALRRFSQ